MNTILNQGPPLHRILARRLSTGALQAPLPRSHPPGSHALVRRPWLETGATSGLDAYVLLRVASREASW